MPDTLGYDASQRRLLIGKGYVENVPPQVWDYEVSGKHVLRQWFSYRKASRHARSSETAVRRRRWATSSRTIGLPSIPASCSMCFTSLAV